MAQRADDMTDDKLRVAVLRWISPSLQAATLAMLFWGAGKLAEVETLIRAMARIEPIVYATKQEQDQRLFRFKANEDRLSYAQDQMRILGARMDAFQIECAKQREHNSK